MDVKVREISDNGFNDLLEISTDVLWKHQKEEPFFI